MEEITETSGLDQTVMITADDRLLKTLPETPFAGLAHYLGNVTDLL